MVPARQPRLLALQKIGGYRFREPSLLAQALVHRSFVNEDKGAPGDNERLEFLGDAVLQLAISDWLFRHGPEQNEGELSKRRSALVREEALAVAARNLRLGRHLLLGKGEESSGGREKDSILSGTLEAVIGAVYLDGGYGAAAGVIHAWLAKFLREGAGERLFLADAKSRLQEVCQSRFHESPLYTVISEEGPDHLKQFTVGVRLQGEFRGFGTGRSKKEAEQNAARDLLTGLEAGRGTGGAP